MKTIYIYLLILGLSQAVYGGMGTEGTKIANRMASGAKVVREFKTVAIDTNSVIQAKIANELKNTMYTAKPSTIQQAYRDRNKSVLNCGGYAFRIKDIADKSRVKSEIWQAGGKHIIIIIEDKGKRVCYSNGKKVRESAYGKLHRLK